jgi:SAM-dependent methyltransferase
MSPSRWSPADYAQNAGFVPALGAAALALLGPQPGELILDIGCGDGMLTRQITAAGAKAIGLDASPEMVEAARSRGVDAFVADAQALDLEAQVTGSAVRRRFLQRGLHWMLDPAAVARGVFALLRPAALRRGDGRAGQCRHPAPRHPRGADRARLSGAGRDPQWYASARGVPPRLSRCGFRTSKPI